MSLSGRIMGLDVGSVRIGVALSDLTRTIAQPLAVVERRRAPGKVLAALVREHEVGQIVVGRPLTLAGGEGPAVAAVEAFVAEVGAELSPPLTWWDERLTTVAAERAMVSGGVRRAKRRQAIDMVAAAILLQSFLDAPHP